MFWEGIREASRCDGAFLDLYSLYIYKIHIYIYYIIYLYIIYNTPIIQPPKFQGVVTSFNITIATETDLTSTDPGPCITCESLTNVISMLLLSYDFLRVSSSLQSTALDVRLPT